jgi:hypothetical protein
MIFLTCKSLALDQHAKQYEALFSGGTVMPHATAFQDQLCNQSHKAWHFIDNIQNKLLKYLT